MAKRAKVTAMVATLGEAFNRTCSTATYDAYFRALHDLSDEQIDTAGNAMLRSNREFMPNPGQIRECALTGGLGVAVLVDAAWLVLCEAIRQHGADKSVNFRDGLINATVRIRGGWQRCCTIDTEEFEKWYRRDFASTYAQLIASGVPPELMRYLPGQLERENAQWVGREYGRGGKRYELPAPVEVGCNYEPPMLSPSGQLPALNTRPADMPKLELGKVNP